MSRDQKSQTCSIGRERRKNKLLQNKQAKRVEKKIYMNGKELEGVEEIKYLGSILRQADDDTHTIIRQIKKPERVGMVLQAY